jgi:DNA-binding CsgD family transcriptional regulator
MTQFEELLSQDPLTEREIEILRLLAAGLSNREIAGKLFLALETIRWYTKRIYSKLQVSNRTQAAAYYQAHQPDPSLPGAGAPVNIALTRHNLPAQVTAFVGRGKELQDFSALMSAGKHRLITLLGPGGMGKTSLAVQVARASIPRFPDGIFFVPLEHLQTSQQAVAAVAETLGLKLSRAENPERELQA